MTQVHLYLRSFSSDPPLCDFLSNEEQKVQPVASFRERNHVEEERMYDTGIFLSGTLCIRPATVWLQMCDTGLYIS